MSQPTDEAKDFSKSEAELVDVMDTLQHAISIIMKDMAKNLHSCRRKSTHGTRTNNVMATLIMRKT